MQPEALTRRYGAYLFDLDGTLIDTARDIQGALNAALASAGLSAVDESLTRHWVGHGSRVLIEQALRFHQRPDIAADEAAMERLRDLFIDHYTAHIADTSVVYPGVEETLVELEARGARLGVVTNKYAGLSLQVLDAFGLRRYFGVFVCGDTLPQRKPDPATALHALSVLGRTPSEALFVGDSATDVATARAAGCAVVCVREGYNHGIAPEDLGADAVIDSFLDLL